MDHEVTLKFQMSDGTTKEVPFVLPGSSGGPGYIPTVITDQVEVFEATNQFDTLLQSPPLSEGLAYQYLQVAMGGEPLQQYPGGVLVSAYPAGDGNIVTYAGVRDTQGNYVHRVRWSDGTQTAVLLEDTMPADLRTGDGITGMGIAMAPLKVRLSENPGNQLTIESDGGLYMGAASALASSSGQGNFVTGVPDNPNDLDSHGRIGSGEYWKVTQDLYTAPQGSRNIVVLTEMVELPCLEDGTLIPYSIQAKALKAPVGQTPTVEIWFICTQQPTHVIYPLTKTIKKLGQDGQAFFEPSYRYFYYY
jgi:hypothetical protein